MPHAIESSRNHCTLLGALQTVQAVEGVVPIIHSTAGCGLQHYLGTTKMSGWNGSGYSGGLATPSSNVGEKQIIFGGASRLREQIKNTAKVVKADLYTVLSGCATELVGDDIGAMTKEAQQQGIPVVHIATPGFRGDVHSGYSLAVKGLIDQLPGFTTTGEKTAGLVNIFGVIPEQDVFWQGHLEELQTIFEQVGLTVNTLFGLGQGIAAWSTIPQAELNLVFSPAGTDIGRYLAEKFATPYLQANGLPVGAEAVGQLLQALQERVNLDSGRLNAFVALAVRRQAHYLNCLADLYYEYGLQREFALVGETGLVIGLARFLIRTLGMIPAALIFTDNLPEAGRTLIAEQARQLTAGFDAEIAFSEDRGQIEEIICRRQVELILGSSLEQQLAEQWQIPFLAVSFPLADAAVLQKSYIGVRGAIAFAEDLAGRIISHRQQQTR